MHAFPINSEEPLNEPIGLCMVRRLPTIAAVALCLVGTCAPRGWCVEADPASTAASLAGRVGWDVAPLLPSIISDAAVEPAQMMMPAGYEISRSGGAAAEPDATGLYGVPFMIGDSGLGPSAGFTGLYQIEINHPTFGASRLSVADANTPLPVDRLYYSYRHLHNANGVNFFGLSASVDVDRHLIGWERTFWDRSSSFELRLPIEDRLNNRIGSVYAPSGSGVDPIAARSISEVELGNIAAILKFLIWEDDWLAVSGGLGIELPTAQDLDYGTAIDGVLPFPNNPGLSGDTTAGLLTIFNNETVYLDPFLAWVVRPGGPWFHQGFLQVNVAANPTRAFFQGFADTTFVQNGVPIGNVFYTAFPSIAQFTHQTLLHLNLGGGRMLVDRPGANGLRQAAVVAEIHYTTTLNDADRGNVPLVFSSASGTIPLSTVEVGGLRDHVDFVSAVGGVSLDYAGWKFINGVAVPLQDSPRRGFDFQYNLQVQKPY